MSKSWTIRELTPDEYPDTQLRYEVRDETGEVFSLHFWEVDARQMVAVPLLREALEELTAVIRRSVLTPILTDKDMVQKAIDQANAVLEAAKGE